jgi:hypothetical protein
MSQPNLAMMQGNNTQVIHNEDLPNTGEMFVDECFDGSKGNDNSMQRRSRGQRAGGGLSGSLGGTQSGIGTQNQSMHCTMQSFSQAMVNFNMDDLQNQKVNLNNSAVDIADIGDQEGSQVLMNNLMANSNK